MEVKLACDCGQHYAFDVEPLDGRMPSEVACPACGMDGTVAANTFLAAAAAPPPAPVAAPSAPKPGPIRLNVAKAPEAGPASAAPPAVAGAARVAATSQGYMPKETPAASLGLGLLGAVIGAMLSSGLLFFLSTMIGFRFPMLGVITGYSTGIGARLLYKDTEQRLGILSALVAGAAVFGTLTLLYGGFPIFSVITLVISMLLAYRTAGM